MVDNPIGNHTVFTHHTYGIREDSSERLRREQDGSGQQPVDRSRLRRAIGTKIQTLRAYRPRSEPGTASPPRADKRTGLLRSPSQSRDDVLMTGVDIDGFNDTIAKFRNYRLQDDPDYRKFLDNPELYGPDTRDPDHADLNLDARRALAALVQYRDVVKLTSEQKRIVNQIIGRGDAMSALRFFVFHSTTFDHDPRMNRFFRDHEPDKTYHRTPNYYKDIMQFNPRPVNVFKSRN